ncbi:hypothetical protein PInf_018274 [Phytophthora infestans]|nr:hypothetical protein PInf_018274 [Phytophthora infestans]
MTKPTPRPISQQYRADSGVLGEAGEQELQYAPVELLSSRAQSDRPAAATFNILNGCRGSVFEANNTVTDLAAGTPFDVEWVIQAPHPGTMVLSIVKPSADSTGTVTYVPVANLLTIDPFAENSSGKTSTTATIPTSVTWCRSPGDCALQFYWHSDLASQTYPTCADILWWPERTDYQCHDFAAKYNSFYAFDAFDGHSIGTTSFARRVSSAFLNWREMHTSTATPCEDAINRLSCGGHDSSVTRLAVPIPEPGEYDFTVTGQA